MRLALSSLFILLTLTPCMGGQGIIMDLRGNLWDIDLATGLAGNPRPSGSPSDYFADVAYDGGRLYAMTAFGGPHANTLAAVAPTTGAIAFLGPSGLSTGLGVVEGDLAVDPATGTI